MKKINLFALVVAMVAFSSSVFAAPAELKGYSSSLSKGKTLINAPAVAHPTNITIINASNSYMYAVIPGTSIYDYLTPQYKNDHIWGDSFGNTYVEMRDIYHNVFFAGYVCRMGILTVYGSTGAFRWNLDSDLCV